MPYNSPIEITLAFVMTTPRVVGHQDNQEAIGVTAKQYLRVTNTSVIFLDVALLTQRYDVRDLGCTVRERHFVSHR